MKLDYVFQSFDGKLIDQIRVDTQDRVFVRIGHVVSTEDYAKGELIYVGRFKDRPIQNILAISNSLMSAFLVKLSGDIKKKYKKSQAIKIFQNKTFTEKVKLSVIPSISKIENFIYSDLLFYKTRLRVKYYTLISLPTNILIDLEKYPAGYARWIVYRLYYNTDNYQQILTEAPPAIKRLKYCLGFNYSIEYANSIKTNSKKDYLISHLCWIKGSHTFSFVKNEDDKNPLDFNKTKEIIERIERNIKRKLNSYKDIKKHYEMVFDYISFIYNQTQLTLLPNKETVKDAIKWHNDGCPMPESCNKTLYEDPKRIKDLEQYRVVDSSKLYQLGKRCSHCIYNYKDSKNTFYYKESDKSIVCAMVDYNQFRIIQCYDIQNKVTSQSKKFEHMIRNTLDTNKPEKIMSEICLKNEFESNLPF